MTSPAQEGPVIPGQRLPTDPEPLDGPAARDVPALRRRRDAYTLYAEIYALRLEGTT